MSARRRRTGRVKVPFHLIEKIAAEQIAESALAAAMNEDWRLTKHSALHRCKDGSYALCLIWHGSGKRTLTSTIRNLRLEHT